MRGVSADVGWFFSFPGRESKANDQTQRMSPAVRHDRLLQQNPPISGQRQRGEQIRLVPATVIAAIR
jgi:hypothetical protein